MSYWLGFKEIEPGSSDVKQPRFGGDGPPLFELLFARPKVLVGDLFA